MSIKEYEVERDNFEYVIGFSFFDFPCCACGHRFIGSDEAPCRTCDHNANAVKSEEKENEPLTKPPE